MSMHLEFEPHGWYMHFAIKKNENHTVCFYEHDGTDTDGTEWYRCVHHDALAPSQDAPCANYDESEWSAFTDDGNTYRIIQRDADTLALLKQRIREYWRQSDQMPASLERFLK